MLRCTCESCAKGSYFHRNTTTTNLRSELNAMMYFQYTCSFLLSCLGVPIMLIKLESPTVYSVERTADVKV